MQVARVFRLKCKPLPTPAVVHFLFSWSLACEVFRGCLHCCHLYSVRLQGQWVFKSASRVTPTYFAVGAAGVGAASACLSRHGASLWSKTTCSDAEKRPAWQHPPPAVPTMRERWNEKSPAREKGPSFWRSHGNGQGRYASTRGATAEDHLAQSGTPRASFAEASSAPVPSSALQP